MPSLRRLMKACFLSTNDTPAEAEERDRQQREQIDREHQKTKQNKRHMGRMERNEERILARLARQVHSTRMLGTHIGVFGLASTGKSTMINSLMLYQVSDVGGTTRKRISFYEKNFTYRDTPSQIDEIAFIKGLTRRLIVIQYSVGEILTFVRLLDCLGLGYDIIVNKFDEIDKNERSAFRQRIRDEIESSKLAQIKSVYFVSAQSPQMSYDWLTIVNDLSSQCINYDRCVDTDSSDSSNPSLAGLDETSDSD